MERNGGLPAARIASIRSELRSAEQGVCAMRGPALTALAAQARGEVAGAADKGRAELMTRAIAELARANCSDRVVP
jgi:hypothetical protein